MAAIATAGGAKSRPGTWHRRGSITQDITLIIVSVVFFLVHARIVLVDGQLTSVFFAVEQGLLIGVFLFRRRSSNTSMRPMDWAAATIGGWLPLALQPHASMPAGAMLAGMALQMIGLTLTCYGFWSLGRSFGLVAANRGLKEHGPYRIVRHPIYLSHTITMAGFLIANGGVVNVALLAVILGGQLLRIRAEERVLRETGAYDAYAANVRWRLIPGLY